MHNELINIKNKYNILSKEETTYLFQNFNSENRHKLILGHLKLAAYEASYTFKSSKCDCDDLFEVAIIGLIKAVDKFDINKKVAFSTYAKKCIDNQIILYLKHNKKQINMVSLNEPISEFNALEDTIYIDDFTDAIDNKFLIKKLLNNFSERDKQILILYYGLNGSQRMNETEIGEIFNLTQAAISAIIRDSLKRMKSKLNFEEKMLKLK